MTTHAVEPIAEPRVVEELLSFLRLHDWFTVYREVEGCPLLRLPNKDSKTFRVDLVLSPRPLLERAGWKHGPIGVECKAPDVKLGKAAAQCRDYRFAVFEVRPGWWIQPQWFFLHPFELPGGDAESMMAADAIGVAHWRNRFGVRRLRFKVGSYNMLELGDDGSIEINSNPPPGRKAGSR